MEKGSKLLLCLALALGGKHTGHGFPRISSKTFVSKNDLDNYPDQKGFSGINSVGICGMLASQEKWASLFCYEERVCTLYSLEVLPTENDSIFIDPKKCYTNIPKDSCKLSNGKIIKNGDIDLVETFKTCDIFECVKGQLKKMSPKNASSSICRKSYKNDEIFGLVKVVREKKTWCEAKMFCLKEGGDLLNLVGDPKPYPAASFLTRMCPYNSLECDNEMWIGLNRVNISQWKWSHSPEIINVTNLFGENETNKDDKPCAHLKPWLPFLNTQNCSVPYSFICQIPIA